MLNILAAATIVATVLLIIVGFLAHLSLSAFYMEFKHNDKITGRDAEKIFDSAVKSWLLYRVLPLIPAIVLSVAVLAR